MDGVRADRQMWHSAIFAILGGAVDSLCANYIVTTELKSENDVIQMRECLWGRGQHVLSVCLM